MRYWAALEEGFNVHIQRKLLLHMFAVAASSDLDQLFRKRVEFGLGEKRYLASKYAFKMIVNIWAFEFAMCL